MCCYQLSALPAMAFSNTLSPGAGPVGGKKHCHWEICSWLSFKFARVWVGWSKFLTCQKCSQPSSGQFRVDNQSLLPLNAILEILPMQQKFSQTLKSVVQFKNEVKLYSVCLALVVKLFMNLGPGGGTLPALSSSIISSMSFGVRSSCKQDGKDQWEESRKMQSEVLKNPPLSHISKLIGSFTQLALAVISPH